MNKPPFDLNAWDYSQPRPTTPSPLGGKAVGLTLCEKIAEGSPWFFVPPWLGVNDANADVADAGDGRIDAWIAKHRPSEIIVRSSSSDEDWFDGRSGVDKSDWCKPTADAVKKKLVERIAARTIPVVVQSYANGYGCVVDVGWSHILQKAVVRVAVGNKRRVGDCTFFSSATWDNEARVGLYDAETGDAIVEPEEDDLKRFMPELARALVDRLRAIGVAYGVQLEIIVHPDFPERYALVQLRPSPNALRGTRSTPSSDGTLLLTTARVSRTGSCEGETIILGNFESNWELLRTAESFGRHDELSPSSETKELIGKIVLWDWDGKPKHDYSIPSMLGAARLGAVGQVSRWPIINSSHGDIDPLRPYYAEMAAKAKTASLLLGTAQINGVLCDAWQFDWPKDPVRLRMVSDGLVGRIYQL